VTVEERVASLPWDAMQGQLDTEGYAALPNILSAKECRELLGFYADDSLFRSTIDMSRYNFGRGEYRYFKYPLPDVVAALRDALYPPLAGIANEWAERLRADTRWPGTHRELAKLCRDHGQARPTPLMLRYGKDDYNCLHQDLYGDIHFPLQAVFMLSDPERDFTGGEFVLVEQRPRMQSRPIVIRLSHGAGAIFPVRERPRRGARAYHRAQMRHGVSVITGGHRTTLGIIFHDAR
jgi:uncharacterized protein